MRASRAVSVIRKAWRERAYRFVPLASLGAWLLGIGARLKQLLHFGSLLVVDTLLLVDFCALVLVVRTWLFLHLADVVANSQHLLGHCAEGLLVRYCVEN